MMAGRVAAVCIFSQFSGLLEWFMLQDQAHLKPTTHSSRASEEVNACP